MAQFQLTRHAQIVVESRAIQHEWIASTIAAPEQVHPDNIDVALVHALARIPELESRVLRVVYNPNVTPVRVVTAYFDRSMRGKL